MRSVLRFLSGAVFGAALIVGVIALGFAMRPAPDAEPAKAATTAKPSLPARDPGLAAARLRAQETLSLFFAERDGPGVSAASLKVEVPAPDLAAKREHIWMSACRATGDESYACIVDDDPETRNLRLGDRYAFGREEISDWMYVDAKGKINGGFSIRAGLAMMDEAERAATIRRLAPLPR